jgi:DsbC/DsbD-like thiol-disulfide interchange protein
MWEDVAFFMVCGTMVSMRVRVTCSSLGFLAVAAFVSAQMLPLATVTAVPVPEAVEAGASVSLEVSVKPREGIHVYAPPQKQYIPISISIERIQGGSVGKPQFPPSVVRTFEDEKVRVYERPFSIRVPVVVPRSPSDALAIAGVVTYQACDDVMCYRPVKVTVRWDLRVQ